MPYFVSSHRRLFYQERGRGPLLMILPGQTSSSAHHRGELAFFGQHYHTVALDFWGTGRSDRLEYWPDDWWEQTAGDVISLIDELDRDRAVLVGTSGGGIVALKAAIHSPERVQAVVADSCVERNPPDWLERAVAERAERTPEQAAFWRQAHGDDWEQVVDADSAFLLRLAERGGDSFSGGLGQIRCPVLFTASLADEMLFDVGRQLSAMAQQVTGSRVFLSSEGGHPLMWSQPGDFRRIVRCFLQEML